MITVIISTNRNNSYTSKVARTYLELLKQKTEDCQLLDLAQLPKDVAFSETYGQRSEAFAETFEKTMSESDKFVFVMPEYNGGFPGILKLFIDAIPPKHLHGKKAGLIGCASGHAGALRPMDQFTNVLNYLRVDVIADKPKLSKIEDAFSPSGDMVNQRYLDQLERHSERMVSF